MEFLAELFGQTAEQQAQKETSDYEPTSQSIKRSATERAFDSLFGRTEAVQEAAGKKYIKNLGETEAAQYLESRGIDPKLATDTTKATLLGRAKKKKKNERVEDRNTDYRTNPVIQQQLTDAKTDRAYLRSRDSEADRRFQATQMESINARRDQTALSRAQLDVTSQQEANRMAEETRRYNERRSDSKRERMAAIIAGLANLGGAFAI